MLFKFCSPEINLETVSQGFPLLKSITGRYYVWNSAVSLKNAFLLKSRGSMEVARSQMHFRPLLEHANMKLWMEDWNILISSQPISGPWNQGMIWWGSIEFFLIMLLLWLHRWSLQLVESASLKIWTWIQL